MLVGLCGENAASREAATGYSSTSMRRIPKKRMNGLDQEFLLQRLRHVLFARMDPCCLKQQASLPMIDRKSECRNSIVCATQDSIQEHLLTSSHHKTTYRLDQLKQAEKMQGVLAELDKAATLKKLKGTAWQGNGWNAARQKVERAGGIFLRERRKC
jgi:hypothetical protein